MCELANVRVGKSSFLCILVGESCEASFCFLHHCKINVSQVSHIMAAMREVFVVIGCIEDGSLSILFYLEFSLVNTTLATLVRMKGGANTIL